MVCFTKKYPLAGSVARDPAKRMEDKKEGSSSRVLETEKMMDDAPTETKSSKSDRPVDAKEILLEKSSSAETEAKTA